MTSVSTSAGSPARRKEIMDAARALASEGGWAGVTVRAVAARIGCSAPALYQYFRDKDAILAALAAEGRNQLTEAITAAVDPVHGPAKRLRAAMRGLWDFAMANPEVYAVMFGLDGLRGHGGSCGPALAILRHAVSELATKRDASISAEDCADSLAAMAHGFIAQTLGGGFPGGSERALALFLTVVEDQTKALGR